ncbi:CLUMA_CG018113, isoform A [Clunio marinus]|uniref:CLUMA_CG018113, isoform A n=1 Tax=Clunio marinus TaxID=568069 RepID=A0A1J1IYV8_9DIPT|nr:CLUMA_CG018113, isoform A [Clunio marinus]
MEESCEMMNVYYFHHQADELLGTASEQFLGKSVKEIKQTILQTLEGHLRAILEVSLLLENERNDNDLTSGRICYSDEPSRKEFKEKGIFENCSGWFLFLDNHEPT